MERYQSDPVDELFGLLRDQRRRLVIHYLRNRTETEPIDVGTLAAAIASIESDGQHPADTGGEDERNRAERVEISLVHTHLPKIHERGIAEFDRENRTVEAAHPPDEFWGGDRSCRRFTAELADSKVEH